MKARILLWAFFVLSEGGNSASQVKSEEFFSFQGVTFLVFAYYRGRKV